MKSIFNKIFGAKEIKAAYRVLDEACRTLNNEDFDIVRKYIEKVLKKFPNDIAKLIKDGTSPREWGYSSIANVAGDLLETGQYHLFPGVINPFGSGNNLLKLFDDAIDELVKMRAIEINNAKVQKKALRDNIKNVG
jgi:hypothetical protein